MWTTDFFVGVVMIAIAFMLRFLLALARDQGARRSHQVYILGGVSPSQPRETIPVHGFATTGTISGLRMVWRLGNAPSRPLKEPSCGTSFSS